MPKVAPVIQFKMNVVIHLEKATERLPIIEVLKNLFNVEVYNAKDGSDWMANPQIHKAHPWTKQPLTQGNIGCTHSHIELIHRALKAGEKSLTIFEDDCDFIPTVTKEEITKFIHGANILGESWDILLLGATEYVESSPVSEEYKRVGRFWGTHALILRERGMRAALKAFADSQKKGDFLPGDWLYNEAIKIDKLACFAPTNPFHFCRQKEGLLSYLTGAVRKYKT
jgi:GR25 family glycosyltransferase involved in LPS biosynthesis